MEQDAALSLEDDESANTAISRVALSFSPEQAAASATPPSSAFLRPAGASLPARATRSRRIVPWEAGPEDHIQVDLAEPENTDAAIAEIKRRINGELHALVNNAAISPKADGGSRLGSIGTSRDDWHHVFQVNFFAPIMLARGLLDELKAAKGSVVNVTSIAGSRVHPFAGAAYATSKAALAALTREMAHDFGAVGVRVNAIAPGEIDTAMLSPGTEKIVEMIPMHRLGTPDEVAKIIYVLCTDTSSYVNGAEIHINGGQHV